MISALRADAPAVSSLLRSLAVAAQREVAGIVITSKGAEVWSQGPEGCTDTTRKHIPLSKDNLDEVITLFGASPACESVSLYFQRGRWAIVTHTQFTTAEAVTALEALLARAITENENANPNLG